MRGGIGGSDGAIGAWGIEELVRDGGPAAVDLLGRELSASNWPLCNELADALVRIGTRAAQQALCLALKARRHHVRSAAIRGLSQMGGPEAAERIAELANDRAYEVRQNVAEALLALQARHPPPREGAAHSDTPASGHCGARRGDVPDSR
jgi:HEAT repeat protein